MYLFRASLLLAFFILPLVSGAQQPGSFPEELLGGNIESQINYLFNSSGNYTNNGIRFKVTRTREFEKLKENLLDSLNATRQEARALEKTIETQNVKIKSQDQKLEEATSLLSQVMNEKDSIPLFGKNVSKTTYAITMWTVFAILSLLLTHFIYRFSRSNVLTQEAKAKLLDLELEYEDHRRKALEREQRISRQLHDEINKNRKTK